MAQKLEFLHVFNHFPDNGWGVNLCVSIGTLLRFLCYCLHQWESHAIPHRMEDDQSVQKCIIVKHYITSYFNLKWMAQLPKLICFFFSLPFTQLPYLWHAISFLGVKGVSAWHGSKTRHGSKPTQILTEMKETHDCITFESHSSVGILNDTLPTTKMEF